MSKYLGSEFKTRSEKVPEMLASFAALGKIVELKITQAEKDPESRGHPLTPVSVRVVIEIRDDISDVFLVSY